MASIKNGVPTLLPLILIIGPPHFISELETTLSPFILIASAPAILDHLIYSIYQHHVLHHHLYQNLLFDYQDYHTF